MMFSDSEKTEAGKQSYHVTNFYAPVTNSQIQQGSTASQQTIKVEGESLGSIDQFIKTLRNELPSLNMEKESNRELSSEIATVEAQISSPNPKSNIIRESLSSIRRILEGAGGGVAAQLLMQLQGLL